LLIPVAFFAGCGEDQVEAPSTGPVEVNQSVVAVPEVQLPESPPALPEIVVEELDQAQESYDEQVVASFGVGDRGWQTYRASKSGYLTRFSLFGRAHTKNNTYGAIISGEIRLGRNNKKLGTWSLSREEVVAQLNARGLHETNYDWIDVKISEGQRIPQTAGEAYLIRSTSIAGGRDWFGSFRFATGDRYPDGAWWHTPDHSSRDGDLVFRTYVGKTAKQVTAERAHRLEQMMKQLRAAEDNTTAESSPSRLPNPVPPDAIPQPPAIAPPDPLPQQPKEQNATKKPLLPFLRPR